ncbi:MAG: amidophosphoribosyltransferase [bacterium]|nr:amidophosphoribosyltransferase [Candidatus Colisoma equi]
MSDAVKHECAVALLRLRRGAAEYGATDFGGTKLSLLLEKQHNRGQDGAGAVTLTLSPEAGRPSYNELKSASASPLADLLSLLAKRRRMDETLFLGHLRYATYGKGDVGFCHPFVHKSARRTRTLFLAGNFNLTNTHELFDAYVAMGKFPESTADGYLICEWLASCILQEEELEKRGGGGQRRGDILISALRTLLPRLDGAYTLCGMTGDGWSFAVRDPHGIRPGYYYVDDEVAVVASERPAIQAAFDLMPEAVRELVPGEAMIVAPDGSVSFEKILEPAERRSCVFERIYFSRANDADIHRERKALGAALAKPLLETVGGDLENTFFSYIPNSAQVAFHGLLEALWTEGLAEGRSVRFGQIAVKDAKFRTFIADAAARREFYQHVYDVTYGLVRPGTDTLVVLDDSIVRGNTMKNAILPMLDRLGPKRIIVASSAPPICYPDCYGIDMSTLGELVAFKALVGLEGEIGEAEDVRELYARHTQKEISDEIARLITPSGMKAKVDVVFQTVEALHRCCPDSAGDWYFTGRYPTPGGERVLKEALKNYLERKDGRSY